MTRSLFSILMALSLMAAPAALADTGDTSDSGEESETADTADSAVVDTGSLQEAYSLSERTDEEGGCGLGSKALLLLPMMGLLARRRRG